MFPAGSLLFWLDCLSHRVLVSRSVVLVYLIRVCFRARKGDRSSYFIFQSPAGLFSNQSHRSNPQLADYARLESSPGKKRGANPVSATHPDNVWRQSGHRAEVTRFPPLKKEPTTQQWVLRKNKNKKPRKTRLPALAAQSRRNLLDDGWRWWLFFFSLKKWKKVQAQQVLIEECKNRPIVDKPHATYNSYQRSPRPLSYVDWPRNKTGNRSSSLVCKSTV